MTDVIEGTAVELPEERALVMRQPGNALIARPQDGPKDMIAHATALADALKDIVERKNLYSTISGKKFPQVEAWMTIGRMDNVVAREAERPIRNEDGSYEAFVELVRLSDGMVIGRASALCGTPDDAPWSKRSEPNRRSMAVTRATSRAFRQQYAWIMALAGYEPTPADEMPHDRDGFANSAYGNEPPAAPKAQVDERLMGVVKRTGTIKKGDAAGYKLEGREEPNGTHAIGFRIETKDGHIPQVLASGDIGEALWMATGGKPETLLKKTAEVKGKLYGIVQPGRTTYYRLVVEHIDVHGDDGFRLPAEVDEDDIEAAAQLALGDPVPAA